MDIKKLISISVVVAVVSFGGGYWAGLQGNNAKYDALVAKVNKAFPTMPSMTYLSGSITAVGSNSFTINSNNASANPLEEFPTTRTVRVTDKTKIVSTSFKDPAVFQKEMQEYQKQMSAQMAANKAPTAGIPPTSMIEKEITIKDLKVGDIVSIETGGKDVKMETSFDAAKVSRTATNMGMPTPVGAVVTPVNAGTGTAPATSNLPLPGTANPTPIGPAIAPAKAQ